MKLESTTPPEIIHPVAPFTGDMKLEIENLPKETSGPILRMLKIKEQREADTSSSIPPKAAEPVVEAVKDLPEELPGWMKREAERLHSRDNPDLYEN